MEKKIIITLIVVMIISGLIGYVLGFSEGAGFAIDKSIAAAEVMLDVKLSGKAKNMVMGFPDLLERIPYEVREKLGLNNTAYKDYQMKKMNETITRMVELKYPKP